MTDAWYYSKGERKHGPVTTKQLKQLAAAGVLQPTDLVWREGLTKWKQAGRVVGLFLTGAHEGQNPPPLPQSPSQSAARNARIVHAGGESPSISSADKPRPSPTNSPASQSLEAFRAAIGLGAQDEATTETPNPMEATPEQVFGDISPPPSRVRSGTNQSRRAALACLGIMIMILLGGYMLLSFGGFLGGAGGTAETRFGRALIESVTGKGTHLVPQDTALYVYPMAEFGFGGRLNIYLQHQEFFSPLAVLEPIPGRPLPLDHHAIFLSKGTTVDVLKTQVDRDFVAHFVRVRDGDHQGKEGWLVDKYIRVNY